MPINLLTLMARLTSMSVKYICSVLAFYFLSPNDFVQFGIVLSAVNLFVLVIGIDVYQTTQRLHVTADIKKSTELFISELSLGLLILLTLSIIFYLLYRGKHSFFYEVIIIIYCDYVILTASRLVLSKASAVISSFITALRVLPLSLVCIYIALKQKDIALENVLLIWSVGSIIVAICTIVVMFKKWLIFSKKLSIDFNLQDYKTSLLFWLSSVGTYFLLFIDKVLVKTLSVDINFVSSYVFFTSMFSVIPAFVDAGIVLPNFKSMLSKASFLEFRRLFKQAFLGSLLLIVLGAAGIYLSILLGIFNHKIYILALLVPILVNTLLGLNYVPGLFLYAKKADKDFFYAHMIQMLFFGLFALFSIIYKSIDLFLISYAVCYALLLFIKITQSRKLHVVNYSI